MGFSGDHSRTIQLVQSGAFEVGVLDYTVWELEKKAGKIDEAQVKVIWEIADLPGLQLDRARRRRCGLWRRLQGKAAKPRCLRSTIGRSLRQFARSKFIPAKNSDYGPIEEVGKVTNLLN